jgi:hypothetical protein
MVSKFKCVSVTKYEGGERPKFVASKDSEWSKYTPSGNFEFDVTNENCFGAFVPGKTYQVEVLPEAPSATEVGAA